MGAVKFLAPRIVGLCLLMTAAAQEPPDTSGELMSFRIEADTSGQQLAPNSFAFDLTDALDSYGASFTYGFDAFGWPAAWSLWGASPQQVELQFSGAAFNDLITGRPRYDLLPTALLRAPVVNETFGYGAAAVAAELRDFSVDGPLTELHYQSGDNGLQRVTALHAQRLNSLLPGTGRLHGTFAYAGAAAKGEYPGSQLQRMRQLLLRVQLQKRWASLEIAFLHNQRRLGAHSGVAGNTPERYNRLIATVNGLGARRRDVRNDLIATARVRLIPGLTTPLVAVLTASNQTLRFTSAQSAVVEGFVRRGTVHLYQDLIAGAHRARLGLEGRVSAASAHSSRISGDQRSNWRLTLQDDVRLGRLELMGQAGLHMRMNNWYGRGAAGLGYGWRQGRLMVNAVRASAVESRVARDGWLKYLAAAAYMPGSVSRFVTRLQQSIGPWDVEPMIFWQHESGVTDFMETAPGSLVVSQLDGSSIGAGFEIGFRPRARRGVYAEAIAWIMQSDYDEAERRSVLPNWTVNTTAGVRYRMFAGDLILDVSLVGRAWSRMRSRVLHSPTGLLVLPSSARPDVSPSGTLDVMAKGQVRTATLFAAFENVLSGTAITPGIEIVPGYPLPAQRFRFGVFWPIIN